MMTKHQNQENTTKKTKKTKTDIKKTKKYVLDKIKRKQLNNLEQM